MTKSVNLTPRQIEAIREFIRTERSGCLSDSEKETLASLFDKAKKVRISA